MWPLLQIVLRKPYITRQKIKSWHLSITLYKTQFKIGQKPYILQLLEKSIAKHFKVLVYEMIFCISFQRTQEKFKPLERLLQHTKKEKNLCMMKLLYLGLRFLQWEKIYANYTKRSDSPEHTNNRKQGIQFKLHRRSE